MKIHLGRKIEVLQKQKSKRQRNRGGEMNKWPRHLNRWELLWVHIGKSFLVGVGIQGVQERAELGTFQLLQKPHNKGFAIEQKARSSCLNCWGLCVLRDWFSPCKHLTARSKSSKNARKSQCWNPCRLLLANGGSPVNPISFLTSLQMIMAFLEPEINLEDQHLGCFQSPRNNYWRDTSEAPHPRQLRIHR